MGIDSAHPKMNIAKKNITQTHDWPRPPKAVKQSDYSRAERGGAKEFSMEYFDAMNHG